MLRSVKYGTVRRFVTLTLIHISHHKRHTPGQLQVQATALSVEPALSHSHRGRARAASLQGTPYGVGRVSVTGLVEGLYILHHGKLTAVGGRFLYARHLENVVFDLGGLPLRP